MEDGVSYKYNLKPKPFKAVHQSFIFRYHSLPVLFLQLKYMQSVYIFLSNSSIKIYQLPCKMRYFFLRACSKTYHSMITGGIDMYGIEIQHCMLIIFLIYFVELLLIQVRRNESNSKVSPQQGLIHDHKIRLHHQQCVEGPV